jgi:hypothetical protein
MTKVDFIKSVKGINTYTNVIDTQFRELISPVSTEPEEPLTIEQFFSNYDTLFYDIPVTGDNSHSTLVERSQQYIGGSVTDLEKQALIEEINALRQQIIDLSQNYLSINKITA